MIPKILSIIVVVIIAFGGQYFYDNVLYRDITYNNKGVDYYENFENEKAIEWYEKALKIKPESSLYNYNMGLAYYDLGDYNKALVYFDNAVRFYDSSKEDVIKKSEVYSKRGGMYYELYKDEEAEQDIDKSLDLDPNDTWGLYYKSHLLLDKGSYSGALLYVDNYIDIDNTYDNAYILKGDIYYYMGNYEEAINYYKEAISLNDKSYLTYYYLGETYSLIGEYDLSLENLLKSYDLQKDYLVALYIGYDYYKLGQFEQALKYMDDAYSIGNGSDDYAVVLYKTMLLDKLGKRQEARSFLKTSLSISEDKFQDFISLESIYEEKGYDSLRVRVNELR